MPLHSADLVKFLSRDSELPTDIGFTVYENGSVLAQDDDNMDVGMAKMFRAHKFLLAVESPVFRRQFFGSLPERADPIIVKQTSGKAFGILLDFVYEKAKDFSLLSGDFSCLFEVRNLGERFQISDLVTKADQEISHRQLSPDNLIEAAKSAQNFINIFPEIADKLMGRCKNFFTTNYQSLNNIRVLLNDHDDSKIDTEVIIKLIKSKPNNNFYLRYYGKDDEFERKFEFRPDGKFCSSINSDVAMFHTEAYVHQAVLEELRRIIEDSEVMAEDDALWPQPDGVSRQELEIIIEDQHIFFITKKISCWDINQSRDPGGVRCFNFIVQDLNRLVDSLMGLQTLLFTL